ncbi:MAG: hypothetical protein KGJ60_03590 [Verrucomicrobiota bacterium]|nr:hypothetical protein [Verrucomicrobiota bacterium]
MQRKLEATVQAIAVCLVAVLFSGGPLRASETSETPAATAARALIERLLPK